MGKQIIDLIGELVPISGNSTVDSIIFAIIGVISFMVTFGMVGRIFDAIGIYDSDIMSDMHWLIRVLVFAGLTWISVKIAQFLKWLFGFQWWVYVIVSVVFIGIIILMYYIKHRISQSKASQYVSAPSPLATTEESELEAKPETQTVVIENRYYCPRCRSKLVKRHGPYGDFFGCESFGKTGCRYTRKYL